MFWMWGPKVNSLSSVTLKNSGCGLWWRRVLLAMIVGCQFASCELVWKNGTSHLSALRTIFLEVLHSAMAVTARCSSFSATSLLRWLLMREMSSAKSASAKSRIWSEGTVTQLSVRGRTRLMILSKYFRAWPSADKNLELCNLDLNNTLLKYVYKVIFLETVSA